MQVNFAHNYSKTFFKGGPRSSETKTASDKPLTAEEFRGFAEQQMFYNEATTNALQAILGILRESATPSIDINDLKFKNNEAYTLDDKKFSGVAIRTLENGDKIEHTYVSGRLKHVSRKGKNSFEKKYVYDGRGLKEVVAETKYGTNITKYARNKEPGSRAITTEFGVYEGSVKKLTLNEEVIAETSADGHTTTCTKRDGSVVVVDTIAGTTTIDYSNCSNRDKDKPIKEIYEEGYSHKKLIERHWENGAYEYFDKNGKLDETRIIKSDGCEIKFRRNEFGNFDVIKETFPPKPEGENTQYPDPFFILPYLVERGENDSIKRITTEYKKGFNYKITEIDSLDGAIDKIQCYSCPLSLIRFYPSGQIKSERYLFNLNGLTRNFEIKFNENGQVDDVIITNTSSEVIEKETSSRYKDRLNEAGYKGYAEYASDFQERARIAISVRKRYEETPQ